jgi:hypothetical protein
MSGIYEVVDVDAHKTPDVGGLALGSAYVDRNARSARACGESQADQRLVGLFEGVYWSWKVVDGMQLLSGQRVESEAAQGNAQTGSGRCVCAAAAHLETVDQRQEDDDGVVELHDD